MSGAQGTTTTEPALVHPSPRAPAIDIEGLTIIRDGKTLLEDISFSVNKAEIVTLIGPNGAGKTTLLRAILGLMAPSSGALLRREGLKVGYVPQSFPVDRTLPITVEAFVRLRTTLSKDQAARALEAVGLGARRTTDLTLLSGGERQRAAITRALAQAPDLLVLDEPVQGVDVPGQIAFYEGLARLRDEMGCAILLASHDLHLVMAASDQVVCLNRHLCCVGEPKAVMETAPFKDLFGPQVSQGLAVYRHVHDHAHGHPMDLVAAAKAATDDGATP